MFRVFRPQLHKQPRIQPVRQIQPQRRGKVFQPQGFSLRQPLVLGRIKDIAEFTPVQLLHAPQPGQQQAARRDLSQTVRLQRTAPAQHGIDGLGNESAIGLPQAFMLAEITGNHQIRRKAAGQYFGQQGLGMLQQWGD